jgi:hypothetical protein
MHITITILPDGRPRKSAGLVGEVVAKSGRVLSGGNIEGVIDPDQSINEIVANALKLIIETEGLSGLTPAPEEVSGAALNFSSASTG